ncbi:MAG: flagellar basal body rod protein FlgB [Myxococcales bacterium]|nr:flagellar basal body rod protein FlgB [Myxococcales bacterium]
MADVFAITDVLQRSLDYHLDRHTVVSSNLANVDTPGFRPFDLVRAAAEEGSASLPLQRTQGEHLAASGQAGDDGAYLEEDRTAPVGADGNSVSLEREMSKLAANDIRFQGAATLVTRHLAMLRYAASDGHG